MRLAASVKRRRYEYGLTTVRLKPSVVSTDVSSISTCSRLYVFSVMYTNSSTEGGVISSYLL